jgi:ABC-2 type transport system ATP-binding protein
MLEGLKPADAGEIEILGRTWSGAADEIRERIGVQLQETMLEDKLTVRETLRLFATFYANRRPVDEVLALVGLDEKRGARYEDLSGGQKQRLALAASVLHEPELLFLDEPTSAVDPESRRDFWEALFDLVDAGTTILCSTHYMDEAERCHLLAILDRGRLVANGSPRALMGGLGASVVEIETEQPRRLRRRLAGMEGLVSAAQLGARLRLLLSPELADPVAAVRAALGDGAARASVSLVPPNLEDVFVAATQDDEDGRPR